MRYTLSCTFALVVLGACSSTDPSPGREIGIIGAGQNTQVIVAPDTVTAGVSFEAVVRTVGMNGCAVAAGERVVRGIISATITPYDSLVDADACTQALVVLPHPVQLTLSHPGPAVIAVRGYRIDGTVPGKNLVTVTRDVWVKE